MTTFKVHNENIHLRTWAALSKAIRSKAPYLYGTGLKQSRRVRGLLEYSQETKGYGQVFIYIQKGLKDSDNIEQIIKSIYNIQRGGRKFRLYLAVFASQGLIEDPLVFYFPFYKRAMKDAFENLLNFNVEPSYLLDSLNLNPFVKRSMRSKINQTDLIFIVVGKGQEVHFSEAVMRKLIRHGNSYLLFIDEHISGKAIDKHIFLKGQES
jgi:hypothetical protein